MDKNKIKLVGPGATSKREFLDKVNKKRMKKRLRDKLVGPGTLSNKERDILKKRVGPGVLSNKERDALKKRGY